MAKKAPPKKKKMARPVAVKKKAVIAAAKKSMAAPKKALFKTKTKVKAKAARPMKRQAAATSARKVAIPVKKEAVGVGKALGKADLRYFRDLLLDKRREILGNVDSMESEAFKGGSNLSNMPIHMADVGTDNFEQEFTLGLIESERKILREIQDALVRIDDRTFGICQGTGKPIPRVRLEAVPWAKYSIEYSRLLESGKLARDQEGDSDDETGGEEDED